MATETVTAYSPQPMWVSNMSTDDTMQTIDRVAERVEGLHQKMDRIIQLLEEIKG